MCQRMALAKPETCLPLYLRASQQRRNVAEEQVFIFAGGREPERHLVPCLYEMFHVCSCF